MDNFFSFFEEKGLFNTCGTDYVTCYDTRHKRFRVKSIHVVRFPDYIVETPYRESFRKETWTLFWDSLSSEEYALAKTCPEDCGFFEFLRETGLIEKHYAAYQAAAEKAIKFWMADNGITELHTVIA